MEKENIVTYSREFIALVAIASLLAFLYVSLEFVFLLSKVSFLNRATLGENAGIFINSCFILLVPLTLFLSLFYLGFAIFSRLRRVSNVARRLLFFLLSFCLILLIFSHIDTFVYTAYKVNIAYLSLPLRLGALFSLAILSAVFSKTYFISILNFFVHRSKYSAMLLCIGFFVCVFFSYQNLRRSEAFCTQGGMQIREGSPNIIIFSSDGLDTGRMSVYGATRDTTPYLREFAQSAVVFTRAYCNAYNTLGSIVSILTGKSPLTTGVIAQPDILTGKDSFEHLPAILKRLGYYCADFDPHNQSTPTVTNMLEGFDEVNGVRAPVSRSLFLSALVRIYPAECYFLHSLFINRMYNKLACLLGAENFLSANIARDLNRQPPVPHLPDKEAVDTVIARIAAAKKPVFIHIHLMGTHFLQRQAGVQLFSLNTHAANMDDNDLYDDALLYMDSLFGRLLNALKKSGTYDRTMLFVHTDHGRVVSGHHLLTPLPLIVKCPAATGIRFCDNPVEYLDIAPSILAALKVNIPDWMEGRPVLCPPGICPGAHNNPRPIVALQPYLYYDPKERRTLRRAIEPPAYALSEVYMFYDGYLLRLPLWNYKARLFVLDKMNYVPVDDKGMREEHLAILLGYLKKKNVEVDFKKRRLYFGEHRHH